VVAVAHALVQVDGEGFVAFVSAGVVALGADGLDFSAGAAMGVDAVLMEISHFLLNCLNLFLENCLRTSFVKSSAKSFGNATLQRLECHTSWGRMPHLDGCEVWHLPCSGVAFALPGCGVCLARMWHLLCPV